MQCLVAMNVVMLGGGGITISCFKIGYLMISGSSCFKIMVAGGDVGSTLEIG